MPRNELVAVQTPQCFRREILESAYNTPYEPFFTDDASVVERAGHYVHLCEGNRSNIKVTTPEDLVISEALFTAGENL
ncbi:MAG: 2-C-methyl-D-erythritol 4-phosphate cytidylyltransferase [Flavobacteriales bacterium]|nr:2-C-methyl-D-erythritol 4-phosphate cytidylyltransferase [Flavobacteriales bacterium]